MSIPAGYINTKYSERDVDMTNQSWIVRECVVCKRPFTLWFNGGELDQHYCCGHMYRLEATQIDYAVYKGIQ